jgi:hypothetical protein
VIPITEEHLKHFENLEAFYRDSLKTDGIAKTKKYHEKLLDQLNKLKRRCLVTVDTNAAVGNVAAFINAIRQTGVDVMNEFKRDYGVAAKGNPPIAV